MSDLKFTGEYVVPGSTPYTLYQEHIARYIFAGGFIENKLVLDVACGTGYGAVKTSTYIIATAEKKAGS